MRRDTAREKVESTGSSTYPRRYCMCHFSNLSVEFFRSCHCIIFIPSPLETISGLSVICTYLYFASMLFSRTLMITRNRFGSCSAKPWGSALVEQVHFRAFGLIATRRCLSLCLSCVRECTRPVSSPDVIPCGCLGLKHQLTN